MADWCSSSWNPHSCHRSRSRAARPSMTGVMVIGPPMYVNVASQYVGVLVSVLMARRYSSSCAGPQRLAEAQQTGQVRDVGVEVRHSGDDVGSAREVAALGGLALGHDLEAQEALRHLGQH